MDKVRIVSMQSVSIERLFCDGPPSSLELVAKFCAQVTTAPLIFFFADPAMRSSLSVTAFSRHGCYPRVFGCGDPTVWKIPECEPRRQVRNVLTQRALYRQGCARLTDPESAVAPIAACAVDFVASKTALLPSNDLVRSMEDGHRRPRRYAACNNQTFRVFISPAPLNGHGHGHGPLPADPGSPYACWRAAFCRYWAGRDRR
jgi:hypothetical protein